MRSAWTGAELEGRAGATADGKHPLVESIFLLFIRWAEVARGEAEAVCKPA